MDRFRMYARADRGGTFYWEDTKNRRQGSLKTKDRGQAAKLLAAKNETDRQPNLNRELVIQQFMNLNPQQQQAAMEQFQKVDPELITNLVQRHVDAPLREQMAVTNDDEWALIELKIAAVMKARTALMADGGGRMGLGGMDGGGNRGFQGRFRARSPEAQALQQALDSDAPATQVRSLLATYRAAHKEKQATLVKAQDDLRAVLSIRQEAIALVWDLLD